MFKIKKITFLIRLGCSSSHRRLYSAGSASSYGSIYFNGQQPATLGMNTSVGGSHAVVSRRPRQERSCCKFTFYLLDTSHLRGHLFRGRNLDSYVAKDI